MNLKKKNKIVAIIPCYKVKKKIDSVVKKCIKNFDLVICVDDYCPQQSGKHIKKKFSKSKKVIVLFNKKNLGVGGAVKTGYRYAIKKKFKFAIKIDGDGQMDPNEYWKLIQPMKIRNIYYTKGNRFLHNNYFKKSPKIRFFGNLILTYVAKFTTGYWNISDPLNGYTCIDTNILKKINFTNIRNDFFFETSMIFLLKNLNIGIRDVKVKIKYGGEISNFKPYNELIKFIYLHIVYLFKRIVK
jgi:glycosyltransferase involved in cell wall biosynthesis